MMVKKLDRRYDKLYRDNLHRYGLERVISLFECGREQSLTALAYQLGGDRGNAHRFLKRLVQRGFIAHQRGKTYVFPPKKHFDVLCLEMDWFHSEPKLFYYAVRDGETMAWWSHSDNPDGDVDEWCGVYTEWGAKTLIPRRKVDIVSWPRMFGSVTRKVIQWFSRGPR